MKTIFSILTLPFRLLKFLNPFYYIKMFIKWTFIIGMLAGLTYTYVLDNSQKESLKNKAKTEAGKVVDDAKEKAADKATELVDTLSDAAFEKIKKEAKKIDIKKITEDKIKEVTSEYTYEEIMEMGKDGFNKLVNTEVAKELKSL